MEERLLGQDCVHIIYKSHDNNDVTYKQAFQFSQSVYEIGLRSKVYLMVSNALTLESWKVSRTLRL